LEAADLLLQRKPIQGQYGIDVKTAELQSASRTTAEVTGAFALMEYDEVKKYAGVYARQELFTKVQFQAYQDLTRAVAGTGLLAQDSPPSPKEIEDWKAALRQMQGSMLMVDQLGAALVKQYDEILAGGSH